MNGLVGDMDMAGRMTWWTGNLGGWVGRALVVGWRPADIMAWRMACQMVWLTV